MDCNSVVILARRPCRQNFLVSCSSAICNLTCMRWIQTKIFFHSPLFHHETNDQFCHLYQVVYFFTTNSFTLNNVAYAMFLGMITLGKPTKGLEGQNATVWPLLTQKDGVMGSWKKRANKDHILEQLCVLHNFNQTTQNRACWERAYPHCSLGKCQLVLRTSKQSFLFLLYALRAPTVL